MNYLFHPHGYYYQYIYILYIYMYCMCFSISSYIYIYIYSIRFPAPLTPSRASSYDFADANSESYSPRAAFAAPQGRFPDSGCANCHPELDLGDCSAKTRTMEKSRILSSHSIHGDPGSAQLHQQ